jgi:hypothetical protein
MKHDEVLPLCQFRNPQQCVNVFSSLMGFGKNAGVPVTEKLVQIIRH